VDSSSGAILAPAAELSAGTQGASIKKLACTAIYAPEVFELFSLLHTLSVVNSPWSTCRKDKGDFFIYY
jgi:hypothetical protein